MDITTIFTWIITNKATLLQIYISSIGVASIIIKLTPTVKDDNFLKKYLKFTGKWLAWNRK